MSVSAKISRIRASGTSVCGDFDRTPRECVLTDVELEALFLERLVGAGGFDLPGRTRSKHAKSLVCEIMGYPVPKTFKKTRPRLPAQDLDIFVQRSDNVQVWNEEIEPARRYLLIRPDAAGVVSSVRVVRGQVLLDLDKTGALTHKEQARIAAQASEFEIVTLRDTPATQAFCAAPVVLGAEDSPTGLPEPGRVMSIRDVALKMMDLPGVSLVDPGGERARGETLHRCVAGMLGYVGSADNGAFPDIAHQMLEVKLQTAGTIDLGLLDPDSDKPVGSFALAGLGLAPRDCRYLIVIAEIADGMIYLRKAILTTGACFSARFPRCANGGNMKYQMALPADFFRIAA